jgi:hypothetical protein
MFLELEKYTWKIECVYKIMELLHNNLKDLMQSIIAFNNFNSTSKINLIPKRNLTTISSGSTIESSTSASSSNTIQFLIFKLNDLLDTLIKVSVFKYLLFVI